MQRRKLASAADIAAAVALGTIDPNETFASPADIAAIATAAATGNHTDTNVAPTAPTPAVSAATLSDAVDALTANSHVCAFAGCRHGERGATHGTGVSQPDRQLKLDAECGAIIRMTARALTTAGGVITDGHGHPFAVGQRRKYTRRSANGA